MVRRFVLLTGLCAALLSGCGDDPEPTDASDPEPSPSSSVPSPSGAPVEFRVVLATDLEPPPDSLVKQQLDSLDCAAAPVPVAPEEPLAICDDHGVKYVLEPASIVGGIESASAGIPEGQVGWAVTIDLDDTATSTFAEVSAELAVNQLQYALVLDGRILTAPTVNAPIPDGRLEITGDFDEESAQALADGLEG